MSKLKNCPNYQKLSKLSKIVKIVENCQNMSTIVNFSYALMVALRNGSKTWKFIRSLQCLQNSYNEFGKIGIFGI